MSPQSPFLCLHCRSNPGVYSILGPILCDISHLACFRNPFAWKVAIFLTRDDYRIFSELPFWVPTSIPAIFLLLWWFLGGSLRKALRVCSPNTARVYFHGSTEPSPKYIMWSALEMPTLWLGWSLSLSQGLHRPTSMWYGVCQPQRIPFHNVIKVKVIPLICYLFVLMWNMY